MKKIVRNFGHLRVVVLLVLVAVVAAVSFGRTSDTAPVSNAASPGWVAYFGKSNPTNYSSLTRVTATDHTQYTTFTTSSESDPYFFPGPTASALGSTSLGTLNASSNKIAVVRYRTDASGKINFYLNHDGYGNGGMSTVMYSLNNDDQWHDLYMDFTGDVNWTGTACQWLRLDFEEGFASGSAVDIAFIAFFDTVDNAQSWASGSIKMGTVSSTTTGKKILATDTISTTNMGTSAVAAGVNVQTQSTGSTLQYWNAIYCNLVDGEYWIANYTASDSTDAVTWQNTYAGSIIIYTQSYASGVFANVSQSNYVEISGDQLITYTYGDTTTTTDVYAPTVVSSDGLTPDYVTGTVSVSGGSTSTSDYTSATSMMRFYRSNLNQYLTFNGDLATMTFTYKDVSARQAITLSNGRAGVVVASLAVYNSVTAGNQTAFQNNVEGPIQFTYLPEGGDGSVIFQDGSLVSAGSYYDQDVGSMGYSDEDYAESTIVYKGCDKYFYTGNFAHHVLPAGTYEAQIEYEILYDKYVIVSPSGYTTSSTEFDGNNMRMWPAAQQNRKDGVVVSDSDGLITSIPSDVQIYVAYDSSDTSTAYWYTDSTTVGGSMSLNGGVFHTHNTSGTPYEKTHVWRRACCVINGVFYEGWIDTHFTNYSTVAAADSNIKSTVSASAADLIMVPRKVTNVDSTYHYGVWESTTYVAGASDPFAVRWTWSFNSEINVSSFTDSQNMLFSAQSEFNTNNYWTITSTGETSGTTGTTADGSRSIFGFGHTFTSSLTYINDYTNNANIISPTNYGLCKVNYVDPLNRDNAQGNYLTIVYRSQDSEDISYVSQSGTNKMAVSIIDGSNPENVGFLFKSVTCDGNWNTVIFDLSDTTTRAQNSESISDAGWSWTRTDDASTTDGIRLGEMTAIQIFPFGYGNIVGGKSMDFAMIGLFPTEEEATTYASKYMAANLSSQKGAVRVINTNNGTVTLTKGASGTLSSDKKLLTDVTAGGTYTVNVTPSSGYYCSKLCWRPTGYLLTGGTNGVSGVVNWSAYSVKDNNYNTYAATDNAEKVTEYVDMLDSNYINDNLFTGGTAVSGWTNSSFGDNVIMTQGQIQAYNAKLVSSYASSERNDQMVDILDVSRKNALTVANIQTYINNMCTEANASSWGLSSAYTNRNYSAVATSYVKYGVITTRTNIRNLPTSTTYLDSSNHDTVQESGIAYGTPVWVLHVSSDGAFYFIQSYNYRGWVAASAVATTTSYQDWIEFADPDIRGDIVVTTARTVTINSQTAEMGVAFPHVSTSGSTYTIKVPARTSAGILSSADATVTSANASLGYLPYTWNNYVTQLFKYLGTAYSWGDADAGRVDCSSFAATVFRTFGFKMMRNTSQQATTGYTQVIDGVTHSYTTVGYYELAKFSGTPMLLTGDGHTVLYLGTVGGKHYIIHSPSVGKSVQVEELEDTEMALWSNYAVMAPQNYLEEAALRSKVNSTGSSFSVTIETPAYGTYNSSTKTTLNDGVNAYEGSLIDFGYSDYADEFILNAGGRDIYVYAVFSKIQSEIAIDTELQIPDGFGLASEVYFGGFTHSTANQDEAGVLVNDTDTAASTRLTVYKGYKLVEINTSGSDVRTTKSVTTSASDNNGALLEGYSGFTHDGTTVSSSGTIYPSYTGVDVVTHNSTDSSVTYVIQPIQYNVVYNSNYPTGTQTTVTATHTWNCTNNEINATATFTAGGTGINYSATKTFSCAGYKFLGWSSSATGTVTYKPSQGIIENSTAAVNYITTGKEGDTYNLYAVWAPVNYTLSVEYVSQVDRELIGTPDGFCVKVGSSTLGKDDVITSETPLAVDLSKYGTTASNNVTPTYADGILSIKSTDTSDPYLSIDIASPTSYDILSYKYMTITYRLSAGVQANKIYFLTNADSGYSAGTSDENTNCRYPGWIADGEWHTVVFNMADMTRFYYVNQYLKAMRIPGGNVSGAILDISAINLYKNPPTVWGESTKTNSSSSASTALTTQGGYTFGAVVSNGTAVNVVSAQQADYDFVMDITNAYLFFYDDAREIYTSAEYSDSGWNTTFGTPANRTINGVTQLGYDVSKYIKNHTFDMAEANFIMPSGHAKLVFVCDYVNYEVKVFSYTATTSYGTISETNLVNTAGTASKAFSEATLTIASSKNDGIVGRYGSTVALSVSNIASGKKFIGWYEKTPDETNTSTSAYGKLVSSDAAFTLSTNLHKDMELVAVFATTSSNETTFNFCNVSGQIIQTLVAAKGSYIPVSNITAVPFKTGSAFSGWEFLKHADTSKATTTTYNGTTYYLLDGTTQTTYKYDYSILYSDSSCTAPAYIYVNGVGGTVNIDACFTKLTSSTVKITVNGEGTINGAASATVAYNTTVTATATGTSAFKGWIDKTNPSTRYTPESYQSGSYYYPFISYSKTFSFKATGAMIISPIYDSAAEATKMPNVNISDQIQRVNTGTTNRYTMQGMFTADPGTTYTILEWGTLCFVAPDSTTVPTTTSYDTATGAVKTQNILSTDTVSEYFSQSSNSGDDQANAAGQYAASINIKNAKTVYTRMYCRYSYVDSTTGETVYVVTYSDTYKFTTSEWTSSTASAYVTATRWDTVADLNPSDYDNLF